MTPSIVELSVVIPVYNEAAGIGPLCARLVPVLERITPSWEIVFVDDGSADDTLAVVKTYNARDPRIGAVSFSRNFGKEIAIAAGLDHARGEAVVIMDADLQHPPEVIETFVARWREGYPMVYGQRTRTSRDDEGPIRRGFARLFYRLFARFGEMALPEGAGDFRLIDRKAVEVLRSLGERARFSKGLYAWIGFPSVGVPFMVEERRHGASKWSFRKLFRFAFDGITSFSTVPLRVWTYIGGFISLLALATALFFLVRTLIFGRRRARLRLADRVRDVLLRHPAHVARHHRRIYRPHLRRGEAPPALRRRRTASARPRMRAARPCATTAALRAGLTDVPEDSVGRRLDARLPRHGLRPRHRHGGRDGHRPRRRRLRGGAAPAQPLPRHLRRGRVQLRLRARLRADLRNGRAVRRRSASRAASSR